MAKTFRNLNKSRFKVITSEYAKDLQAGSPHPIKYLLFDRLYMATLTYEIPTPIDIVTLKVALGNFTTGGSSTFTNDVIKIHPFERRHRALNELDTDRHDD